MQGVGGSSPPNSTKRLEKRYEAIIIIHCIDTSWGTVDKHSSIPSDVPICGDSGYLSDDWVTGWPDWGRRGPDVA